jgi:hypothetical protein
MMDFGLSFSYVFKDREWFKKLAIPALCSLIPVVGQFIIAGWGLKATKNVIDGKVENALPNLDFGGDLGRGFLAAVITFLYSLPIAVLVGLSSLLFSFTGDSTSEFLAVILMIFGACLGLFALLFGILIAFMSVAGVANFVAKGQFGAAFKFKEVFGLLKKSFVSWLLVIIGQVIALGIIAPLGAIVCVIGVLLTTAYGIAVYSHLLGQAYNQSASPVLVEVDVL